MSTQRAQGFTLIELSIVLVIIGLLAGGVLVGRDLIRAAAIHQEVSRLTSYETAFYTFTLKYNAIPGDFNQPGIIGGVTVGHYGDGNGIIDNFAVFGNSSPSEGAYAWEHLSKAGLIEGNYDGNFSLGNFHCAAGVTCPGTPFNQTAVPFLGWPFQGGYALLYGSPLLAASTNITMMLLNGNNLNATTGMLTVDQAYAIDAKLDDGVAYSGRVLTINPALAATGCIDGSPRDRPLDFTSHTYNYNLATDTIDDCEMVYVMR